MTGNIVVISSATLPAVQSVNGLTGPVQLQITGDVSSSLGSLATTLATVNSNVGSFGDASHTVTLTVNGKGLVTAAAANSIAISASQITSGTIAAGIFPALAGDVSNTAGSLSITVAKINGVALGSTTATAGNILVGSGTQWASVAASGDVSIASSGAHTLATVNSNTGSWGSSTQIPSFTVNAKGLITAASNVALSLVSPPPIGSTTANTGAFTTLSASSTVSGAGFSTYLASPPAIGGTAAAAGSFTNLSATGTLTGFPGRLLNIQVFTASGTYTNTTGTNKVVVEVLGAGGGGGGCAATGAAQSAGGAAASGGSYAKVLLTSGFTGGITITIGAAGTGGAAGINTGVTGGASSFGSVISCPGGIGGGGGNVTSAAGVYGFGASPAAPTISSGTTIVSIAGSPSAESYCLSPGVLNLHAMGASSVYGFGGAPRNGAASGNNAVGYGAGGSGGNNPTASNATAMAGGNGSAGLVIVWEFS